MLETTVQCGTADHEVLTLLLILVYKLLSGSTTDD